MPATNGCAPFIHRDMRPTICASGTRSRGRCSRETWRSGIRRCTSRPNLQGDLADYLASLERVRALQPPVCCRRMARRSTTRKRCCAGTSSIAVNARNRLSLRSERAKRHPEALVPLIYRGLKDNLLQIARETVLAHLLKLEREGRAVRRGDSWHIMEP